MSGSPQRKPCWKGWWYRSSVMILFTLLGSVVSTSGPPSGGGSYYHPPPPPPPDHGVRGQGNQGGPPGPPSQQGPSQQGPSQGYYPQGYYPPGPRQGGPGPQQPPPPPPPAGGPSQGYYPPRDGPRGPYPGGPPAPGGYGGYPGAQQAQQPQQQQDNGGGFWSKLKNTVQIFTGNDEPAPGSDGMGGRDGGYGMPSAYPGMRPQEGGRALPPALPAGPQGLSGAGAPPVPNQPQRPPPSQQAANQPMGPYPGMAPWRPPQQQQQEQPQGPGLFQRLTAKVISGAQNILDIGNEGRPGPPPPMGPNYRGNYGMMGPGMYPGSDGPTGPPRPQGPYGAPPSGYGQGQQPPQYGGPRPGERPGPGSGPVPPPPRGPYYGPGYDGRAEGVMEEAPGTSSSQPPAPVVEEEVDLIPDMYTVDDNIVLVNKPTLLRHKLDRYRRAGPAELQVITSFDGGLTRFRTTSDNRQKADTTESLLHNAVVMEPTQEKLRGLVEKYDKKLLTLTSPDERYANREDLKREVQRVVETEGNIYIAAIRDSVQQLHSKLPVRPNLESFLKPLAYWGVPTYVFCPGYGDVVLELLRQGCPGLLQPPQPPGYLPRTLHLVSNLFRHGPYGVVNGFTYPVIHEHNCNMTTAMMGQQPLARKNAIVVTSSSAENDVAAGLASEEQLRVVFVDRDCFMDIPRFLESADAVVLGDGGMQYVSQLVDYILPKPTGKPAR